jgi:formylglycine-generating enzyme required for sulfatase activity
VSRPSLASIVGVGALAALALGAGLAAWREARPPELCPEGMALHGPRCCGEGQTLEGGRCRGTPRRCSGEQEASPDGCRPRPGKVLLPAGRVERRPTDWDDRDGASAPLEVDAFAIDRHEVTEGEYAACVAAGVSAPTKTRGEPGLPQTDVTAKDAAACCAHRGGVLPTRAQLAYAAMGTVGRRYPWGDAGAVCRRVSHGLVAGPCARGADGPQLAEARGGSFRDESVTALRNFSRRPVPRDGGEDFRGFRCVYAATSR